MVFNLYLIKITIGKYKTKHYIVPFIFTKNRNILIKYEKNNGGNAAKWKKKNISHMQRL